MRNFFKILMGWFKLPQKEVFFLVYALIPFERGLIIQAGSFSGCCASLQKVLLK